MSESTTTASGIATGFLEHFAGESEQLKRVRLEPLPFVIGRSKHANLTIYSDKISREHVEISFQSGDYFIRDMGSRNGTFLNGQRVTTAQLCQGDIIHVGEVEFRFTRDELPSDIAMTSDGTRLIKGNQSPPSMIRNRQFLNDLIQRRMVSCDFQSINRLTDNAVVGYEALGRGACSELAVSPMQLFNTAEQFQMATELSRLFRVVAAEWARKVIGNVLICVNTHPQEMLDTGLIESLDQILPEFRRGQTLVLEVHEKSVTDLPMMKQLRDALRRRGILLAYDDFGAGYARLIELVEVPPDFVKLDMVLIRDIHKSGARQELVAALSRVANDLGIKIIAEGIETAEELECCIELGCHMGQGYLLGRPQPAALFDSFSTNSKL